MVQDCFKLFQYIEDTNRSLSCFGPFYIVVVLLHMIFTCGQTFFIFKSHKVRQPDTTKKFALTLNRHSKQAVREAATICHAPASWPLTFWPWKWCRSRVWRGLPVPILVFLCLSVLDLTRQIDVRQTGVRYASSLNASALCEKQRIADFLHTSFSFCFLYGVQSMLKRAEDTGMGVLSVYLSVCQPPVLCHKKTVPLLFFCNVFSFCWPILAIFFTVTTRNDQRAYLEQAVSGRPPWYAPASRSTGSCSLSAVA